MYVGAKYEFPCIYDDDALTFRAAEFGQAGGVGLEFIVTDDMQELSVVVGIDHLNELHAAVNAALEAVATHGIHLAEEAEEKKKQDDARAFLKRWGLDKPSSCQSAEPS